MRDLSLTVICSKCGKWQTIASGYNAAAMSRQKQFIALSRLGWQVLPVKLCRDCACPLKEWEKERAMSIESSWELSLFRDQMKAHYAADKVDRWFDTIEVANV